MLEVYVQTSPGEQMLLRRDLVAVTKGSALDEEHVFKEGEGQMWLLHTSL